jgi:transposase
MKGDLQMDLQRTATPAGDTLYGALELSKNTWLVAIQFPDRAQPSLYPISGGDPHALIAKLMAARDRWAKVNGKAPSIVLCYEAGYDAFWLARLLKARAIECLVIDAASLKVNRRGRRAKTDRIDVAMLLRSLIAWCRGERHVFTAVRIPSVEEEDLRRSHRERSRLVHERTAHINRIKGLLFGQGIREIKVLSRRGTLKIDKLLTGEGRPLPPRLANEIARELERLTLVQKQLVDIERELDEAATTCHATEKKRRQLMLLKGIGPTFSAVMAREVYYRQFDNRRQIAGFLGLATSAYDSGELTRSQGISRAGSGLVRSAMIQASWLWLRHQPKSALTLWFQQRTQGQSGRIRRIMIVALARKLAIALWRYLEQGLVPQGAILAGR